MSTKTQQTDSINDINDGGNNTASEVRNTLNTIGNNTYGDVLHEVHTGLTNVQVITAETTEDNFYNLFFCKQGRKVTVNGVLIGKNTSIDSSMEFVEIINSDYFPDTDTLIPVRYFGNASTDSRPMKLFFNSLNVLCSSSSLGVGESIYVDFTYYTEN